MRPILIAVFIHILSISSSWALKESSYGRQEFKRNATREVSLIQTEEGFFPNHIYAFVGEEIVFHVTTTRKGPGCLFIPEKEIYIGTKRGAITSTKAQFLSPGKYSFLCPNGKAMGIITVKRHPKLQRLLAEQARAQRRLPASMRGQEAWSPKEDPLQSEL